MRDEVILNVYVQTSTLNPMLRYLFQALKQISVKGKTVLVIGTMTPWVEAVILSK